MPRSCPYACPSATAWDSASSAAARLQDAFEAVEQGAAETAHRARKRPLSTRRARGRRSLSGSCAPCHRDRPPAARRPLGTRTIVLPAGTFAEAEGTLVSNEGRAQRFFQLLVPEGDIQESWRWLRDMLDASGRDSRLDAAGRCDRRLRQGVADARSDSAGGALARIFASTAPRFIARRIVPAAVQQSMPRSQCTSPSRPRIRTRRSPSTMEGYYGPMPSALVPYFWAPSWNSVRAVNKFQDEVGGPLRGGDPGIRLIEPALGAVPRYFDNVPAAFREAERRVVDRTAARDLRQRGTEPPGARRGRTRPGALSRPEH